LSNKDSEILYIHLTLNNNLEQQDFKFQFFSTNIISYRHRLKNDLILILKTCSSQGLNSISDLFINFLLFQYQRTSVHTLSGQC